MCAWGGSTRGDEERGDEEAEGKSQGAQTYDEMQFLEEEEEEEDEEEEE